MAQTTMSTTNPLTVKLWSIQGFVDMYKNSFFGHMSRRGTLIRAEELDRAEAGDELTFNFTGILTGTGITEGGTLTGNEEALDNQAFTMRYNVVRHAVANPNEDTIEQSRTLVRFEERARTQLPKWHMSRVDASVFNQLAGVDSTTITTDGTVYSGSKKEIVQGLNAVNVPTANRVIRAAGAATDEALTSSDTFTLDLVDAAVELAGRTYPHIEGLGASMDEFDLFVSYEQLTDLKRDTSGKIQWYTNYLSAMEGGMTGDDNPIMSANQYAVTPVGKYANVNIYTASRVATGVNSSTSAAIPSVRRAVLCGANAIAFASRFSGALEDMRGMQGNLPFKFFTQLKDYDYIKGIEARMIYGVKKIQFDGEDYGSIVISTYAGAHAS